MTPARIWTIDDPVAAARADNLGLLVDRLGIEFVAAGDDWLSARMPVVDATRQPAGFLHGGAALVLAETLASAAAFYTLDRERESCLGLEINANHLRPIAAGWVHGRATPLHRGRTTQVWDIRLQDDAQRPTCIARCTMAIVAAARAPVATQA